MKDIFVLFVLVIAHFHKVSFVFICIFTVFIGDRLLELLGFYYWINPVECEVRAQNLF